MRMLLLGALAVLSSCSRDEPVTVRAADVTVTTVSAPSVERRGEVELALQNDEALALLAVWTTLGRLGSPATNP
ncbi:MAG: hypothetical protein ACO1OB_33285 [Archangium sp.]